MTKGSSSETDRNKPLLSASQVFASSAAAVSAAIVASFFGVGGTLIGAAVTSMVATVGTALYAHSLKLTRERVTYRLRRPGGTAPAVSNGPDGADGPDRPGVGTVVQTALDELRHHARQLPWRMITVGTMTVFVVAVAVITIFEGLLGRSLAGLLGHDSRAAGETTVSTVVRAVPRPPLATTSPSPSPSSTPTTGSPTPSTSSASPTASPTASPSSPTPAPSSVEPTPSPTAPESSAPPSASASPS